jgi:hypothetical protein
MVTFRQFLESAFSEDEEKAVLDYIRDSRWFNSTLRSNYSKPHPVQAAAIAVLDGVFAKIKPSTQALTLYRAMPRHVLEDRKIGEVYLEKGYISTVAVRGLTRNPGYVHPEDRVIVTVKVPEGIHVLNVHELVSSFDSAPEAAKRLAAEETESLLPRNLSWSLLSFDGKKATIQIHK